LNGFEVKEIDWQTNRKEEKDEKDKKTADVDNDEEGMYCMYIKPLHDGIQLH
jgi:hypothetical protein